MSLATRPMVEVYAVSSVASAVSFSATGASLTAATVMVRVPVSVSVPSVTM